MIHPDDAGRRADGDGRDLSRRKFLTLGAGVLAVAATPGIVGSLRRRELVRRSAPVMGTLAEVAVVDSDERRAHEAIDAALAELRWVDRTMTRFSDRSDVGRANRLAAGRPVPVTKPTASVLEEALRWADASGGFFDPCLAAAVELWNVKHRREPPPPGRIRDLRGRELYRKLEIRSGGPRPAVRYHDPDVAVDLGGIAKGYGVDRAADALRERGVESAMVNAGGDLAALGRSPDGDPWRVGVRSPEDPRRILGTFPVSDRAVATSGDYEQYFEHGGRRYHHLLDPRTGAPRRAGRHSLTVVADRCTEADAAATASFGLDEERARGLVAAAGTAARIVRPEELERS